MSKCLRCGVSTAGAQTFCEECVAFMEQSPVPPGTPVLIQKRPVRDPKTGKRKRQTQADTIRRLYRQLRLVTWLCILFGALVVTLSVLLFLTLY